VIYDSMHLHLFFPTVKTAALYLVSIKSCPGRSCPTGSHRIHNNPTLSDGRIRRDSDSRKPLIILWFPTFSDSRIPANSDNRIRRYPTAGNLSDPTISDNLHVLLIYIYPMSSILCINRRWPAASTITAS